MTKNTSLLLGLGLALYVLRPASKAEALNGSKGDGEVSEQRRQALSLALAHRLLRDSETDEDGLSAIAKAQAFYKKLRGNDIGHLARIDALGPVRNPA